MNFLGHLYVSGEDPLVITGNFMADGVKGRDLSAWSPGLQNGIRLHRAIDTYTDAHPLTSVGRARLHAHAGKYSGVALDMFYDHIIAREWVLLSNEPLHTFTRRMYALLTANADLMPERAKRMLPYMVEGDWLSSYARIEGIDRAMNGLGRRVPGGERLSGSVTVLQEHFAAYRRECLQFVHELKHHLSHRDE